MNPAALSALLDGDIANAVIASTPGGIEAQEAAGQRELCHSQRLPTDMGGCREALEKLGFVFGSVVDKIFYECTFPAGWALKPTDHSMWSDLVDDKGRKRAGVFYKAAFYDRSAHMNLSVRYRYSAYKDGSDAEHRAAVILDGETEIHRLGEYPASDYAHAGLDQAGMAWLQEHYPNWADPTAYWD